jgi:S-adenosylmethionine:tRNA ribosyltransferase-isomerase
VRVEELDYELPEGHIAQFPPKERDGGRLLELDRGEVRHLEVRDLVDRLPEGALLVLNDTRVQAARLLGHRAQTQGKVELLLLERQPSGAYTALSRAKRPLEPGERIVVGDVALLVEARSADGSWLVRAVSGDIDDVLERYGHVPLPPYVKRADEPTDRERYQTVFARHLGSSAAPTAGLHLSDAMLERIAARGIEIDFVTLHVGLGTFRPVSAPSLAEHHMHEERLHVSAALVERVNEARKRGGRVVAVGTTVVRALESAARSGELLPESGRTSLLISPGYTFRVVDGLLTNFHAPRSTLLALVYAFAGAEAVRGAYAAAIHENYRFLSYGDAMWIPRRQS